ncbi:hypothetical protein [Bacillus cereus]|uniref:hypothetical protein n=1 Tax=Bacillus cereus TaxID=1396 RepID=UPI0011A18A8C|nr:hypothetical protein [Bacillus cereus]
MKLVDNGLDSFKKSIIILRELHDISPTEYESKLKELILSFQHSLETLFKYMVSEKHPFLIYEELTKVCKHYVLKDFKPQKEIELHTIKYMEAVNMAIIFYELQLNEYEYNCFDFINKYRNQVTHHEFHFEKGEVEHLISKLLPVTYKIFKEHIDEFQQFIEVNHLQSNLNNIEVQYKAWKFVRSLEFYQKVCQSSEKFRLLEANGRDKGQKINALNQHKREHTKFFYEDCPLCGCSETSFIKRGVIIHNAEEKAYYGNCLYCEVEISREDAQYIYQNMGSYAEFRDNSTELISNIITDILNPEHNLFELLNKTDITLINDTYLKNATLINEEVRASLICQMDEYIEQYKSNYIANKEFDYAGYVWDATYKSIKFFREDLKIEEGNETINNFVDNFNILSRGNLDVIADIEEEEEYEETIPFKNDHTGEDYDEFDLLIALTYKIDINNFHLNIEDFNEFLQTDMED